MDLLENLRSSALEIVSLALRRGIDLNGCLDDFVFQKGDRWIDIWRKDSQPASGPAHEPLGTLHYSLQGAIITIPDCLKETAEIFRGAWGETGTFADVEHAVELVKAWLVDRKEVDELPARTVRSYGI